MTRLITVAAASATIVFSLACGGGASYANKDACVSWVETQNALPCMSAVQQDAGTMCPDTLDQTPIDMASYYNCMEENAKCNGDIPDLMGQTECTPPGM